MLSFIKLRVIRFLLAGGTAAAVNLFLLYTLTEFFGWWYLSSATISFLVSFLLSFILQKFWVFADPSVHKVHRQLSAYFLVAIFNLCLNNTILYTFVEYAHLWYILAQVIASMIVAVWSFYIYKVLFNRESRISTNLLIITQKVDINDTVLGFFHVWVKRLAKEFPHVIVFCLEKGVYDLPQNVEVVSLGKESGEGGRLAYIGRLAGYLWRYRSQYGKVFVHMNQEYVILAGLLWRLSGKKIFLWRNHKNGGLLTTFAVFLSNKVFCTSPVAFVARFKKTVLMPVGIDNLVFKSTDNSVLTDKFLVLGRVDPVKNVDAIIDAVIFLKKKGTKVSFDIVGESSPKNVKYYLYLQKKIVDNGLNDQVHLLPAIPYLEVPETMRRYKYFVNLTSEGSLDKTILEALSSGLSVIVANPFFNGKLPNEWVIKNIQDTKELSEAIERMLSQNNKWKDQIRKLVDEHSLNNLVNRIIQEVSS